MRYFVFVFAFAVVILNFSIYTPTSSAQLATTESRNLLRIQQLLEYPPALNGWTNWTNFCYLPPSLSVSVLCSGDRVTELTVTGNKTSPSQTLKNSSIFVHTLSQKFSIDAFFTTVTKLSSLKKLSLVSLGLWGPLPDKINRLQSLQVLNLSSNFISGEIPQAIASLVNLTSLCLTDNLFNGSVPDLRSLVLLEELNLGDNRIGPNFPSLGKNLITVILANNSLRSVLPLNLTIFSRLQRLDVSYNKFVGSIRSSLFSLPSIQYLNLAQNQFGGEISRITTCSNKLSFVDISHNLLIGKLPECIASSTANRTVVSSWNCLASGNPSYQHSSSYCSKVALAVKPPSIKSENNESSIKFGMILGIIGGIVGVVGACLLLILGVLKRSQRKKSRESNKFSSSFVDHTSNRNSPCPVIHSRNTRQSIRSGSIGLPQYQVFSLEEMEEATNNFDPSNILAEESEGQLYKGWHRDGSVVTVQCLKLKQKFSSQSLVQYTEMVSKLRHRHLVSVLGHCIVTYHDHPNMGSTVFIVFQHIANGSLRNHLTDWRKKEMLKWPQRMAITIGVARGIQFLHMGMVPGIFGNDLKIDKVLLDENLTAKIGSYSIPFQGKGGSESHLNGSAESEEKDDIYQFGVILLEIITGRPITSNEELEVLKLELEEGLIEGAAKLRAISDSSIRGSFAYESLKTAAEITVNCLNKDSSKRPSIEDVLWNLQYSIQVQEGWTSSGNLSTK